MAKSQAILFFVATVLCLVGLASAQAPAPAPKSGGGDKFNVEGRVYCDTCRAQFITKASVFLEGAQVRLECRNLTGDQKLTLSVEGVTDKDGKYSLEADGDYEDDDCEVVLVKSPKDDCTDIPKDTYARQSAKVSLTSNNGVVDHVRHANPLGFLKKDPLPECAEILKELGLFY